MPRTESSARQEAERLVATVLAMASAGGRASADHGGGLGDAVLGMISKATGASGASGATGASGGAWATGSAECCVCPLCRVIAGLRDPDAETTERLATGAGDFAAGVASLLRAFSAATGAPATPPEPPGAEPRTDDDPWAAATATGHDPTATVPRPAKPATPVSPQATTIPTAGARARDPWAAATAEVAEDRAVGTGDEARPDTAV